MNVEHRVNYGSNVGADTGSGDHETVAVVIPYYNGSKYIERSAHSVLNQTRKPDEFIVIDDGSDEDEGNKLNEIASRMGFKVARKENGGQGSARNFGVEQTNSKYICFLDQDDFFLKPHIQTLLNAVDRDDPHFGWVYGDLMEADEDGNIIRSDMVTYHSTHPKRFINDLIAQDMHILPSASLINREAYEAVGGFDPQFTGYEDDDLFLRIFRKGYSNYFIHKPVTVWCINNNSTSYSVRMSRSRLKYIKKLCSTFPDDTDKKRFYVRDLVYPRFNALVIGEAFRSLMPPSSPQDKKMALHRDELIELMNEYISVIKGSTVLPWKRRLKMNVQAYIINMKSPFLTRASFFAWNFLRSLRLSRR
ncbi:glycosyltransferase family 2 protein [Brucella pseudogrignonensis]|uniref:glycosyltransferase family 2 protein n=1 Tax=Brucella pseudogrignonensis TaxID=419475 RepID=UPI0038B438DD